MNRYMTITEELVFAHHISEETADAAQHYPHTHPFCELYFYVSGKCSYIVENGVYEPMPGTVIFTRGGEMHGVRIEEDCVYERYYFQIQPHLAETFGFPALLRCFYDRPHGENNSIVLPFHTARECFSLLERTENLFCGGERDAGPLALAAFFELLHKVSQYAENPAAQPETQARSPIVNTAMRYINDHLADIRSPSDLAAKLYVRREYLSRQFTTHIGITLGRYLTMKRVALAKSLLSQGQGKSLEEICMLCGWQDYNYFITVFRQETGETPMRYRNRMR